MKPKYSQYAKLGSNCYHEGQVCEIVGEDKESYKLKVNVGTEKRQKWSYLYYNKKEVEVLEKHKPKH